MAWNKCPAVRAGIINIDGLSMTAKVVLQLMFDAFMAHDLEGTTVVELAETLNVTQAEVRAALTELTEGRHIAEPAAGTWEAVNAFGVRTITLGVSANGGKLGKAEQAGQGTLGLNGPVPRTREQAGYQEKLYADHLRQARVDIEGIRLAEGSDGNAGYKLDIRVRDVTLSKEGVIVGNGHWVSKLIAEFRNRNDAWDYWDKWLAAYDPANPDKEIERPAPEYSVDDCAKECHEANRQIRIELGEDPGPFWEDAPQEMRDSTYFRLRFALENPEAGLEKQHEQWMADKFAAGWIFGNVKDADLKTHPCLVAYDKLPEGQRRKDASFLEVVAKLRAVLEPKEEPEPTTQPMLEQLCELPRHFIRKPGEYDVPEDVHVMHLTERLWAALVKAEDVPDELIEVHGDPGDGLGCTYEFYRRGPKDGLLYCFVDDHEIPNRHVGTRYDEWPEEPKDLPETATADPEPEGDGVFGPYTVTLEDGEQVVASLQDQGKSRWRVTFKGAVNDAHEFAKVFSDKTIKEDPEGWCLKTAQALRTKYVESQKA